MITLHELNLQDFNSVRKFAGNISNCHLLVNCAGRMSPPSLVKADGIETTMSTNYLGHFLLTNLLLPTMQQTSINDKQECRIINVTSAAEREAKAFPGTFGKSALRGELPDSVKYRDKDALSDDFNGLLSSIEWMTDGPQPYFMQTAYSNSSLCILLSTIELARRLNPDLVLGSEEKSSSEASPQYTTHTPRRTRHILKNEQREHNNETAYSIPVIPSSRITVNAVCPGYSATPFWNDVTLMKYVGKFLFKSPEKASQLLYNLATSPEYDGINGNFYSSIPNMKPSSMALSPELGRMVWEHSCELVGISRPYSSSIDAEEDVDHPPSQLETTPLQPSY